MSPSATLALLGHERPIAPFLSRQDRALCTATAVDICRTLKGADMDMRRTLGTQLANARTGEVIYTPPEGEAHDYRLCSWR
jgi:hypothetical protein